MKFKTLTSRENPAVKRYLLLAGSRKERMHSGLFATEGLKLTCEAFAAGCSPMELFATQEAWEKYSQLEQLAARSGQFYRISQPVADKMAQSVSTQGVFAVFRKLDNCKQTVTINRDGRYILLSSLQDPGNIGTILRTAAAFGIDGVIVSADCPDLYSPKLLRATMGGVFKLPVMVSDDLSDMVDALKKAGVRVYAAALGERTVSPREVPLTRGCAVVIGNEGNGLSSVLIEQCDCAVTIPMRPNSESLNAAMAAGILMWEMCGRGESGNGG